MVHPIASIIGSLLTETLPYIESIGTLAGLGKFVYKNTLGRWFKPKRQAITASNYNDAVQQIQNVDVDFGSSLSQKGFNSNLGNKANTEDGKELQGLLQKLNLDYNTANKQDYFRGNYDG